MFYTSTLSFISALKPLLLIKGEHGIFKEENPYPTMKKTLLPYTLFPKLFILLGVVLMTALKSTSQIIDLGKSYINVTKGLNGGTVETGDTLEIRASLVVRAGVYDSCAYFDAIPAGTAYIPGTVRVLTNEGKIYKQFTDAVTDDEGWRTGATIRINLGFLQTDGPARYFRRGRVRNTHKPSFYGSACIMVASFRIRVTSAIGSMISLGGGSMTYRNAANPLQTFTFPANNVAVYTNYGTCANSVGVNSLGTESNGTFGSGRPRNRGASANVPPGYAYMLFTTNTPNDYTYGVANNTSTNVNYTTSNTWPKPDNTAPSHRVFSVWDIIGDHTGAVSPTLGNPAADTVANANAGYMLVVNAAYRIDSAFQHTISNLCPNTYYEISCWMRNICSKCGCDSNGKGATNATGPPFYIPTAASDSSGVYPNITFEVNGIDYYTTGNLRYSGQWVKKGFTFLTGPTQTSFTLKFFNNAPGGGGNDWALDDITVATCTPDLVFNPSQDPVICRDNLVDMSCQVLSFFNNYTYYKWQRSTNNGVTWNDTGVGGGPAAPSWNGSAWQYTVNYPSFVANQSDSGHRYRVVVATTSANRDNAACAFTESGVITVNIIQCGPVLATDIISFTGQYQDGKADLTWTTNTEEELVDFEVEKSSDGRSFSSISTLQGHNDPSAPLNTYTFTDPIPINSLEYYRIKMTSNQRIKYSRTIPINNASLKFSFLTVVNPFSNELKFDIVTEQTGPIEIELIDGAGNIVKKNNMIVSAGINQLKLTNTSSLAAGIYTLRLQSGGMAIYKRVMKNNP